MQLALLGWACGVTCAAPCIVCIHTARPSIQVEDAAAGQAWRTGQHANHPPPAPPAWSCAEPCTVSAWSRGKAPVHQQPRRTGATPGHLQADDVIVQGCQDAAQHVDCALAGLRHGDEVVKHAGPCRWVLLLQAINSLSALWTMGTSSDGRRLRHGSARLPCTQLPGCLQTCRGRGGGGA